MVASDLDLLEAAARAAGDLARKARRKEFKTWSKGSAGPVTEVDLAIDKLLKERLLAARPTYGWLSEETPDGPERLSCETIFVIDPIDGTQAFIANEPEYTISIGLVHKGEAVAGAVYNPATREMFVGARGHGMWRNGEPCTASARETIKGAHMIGRREFFISSRWPDPWPPVHVRTIHSIAYRLALVASGRQDGVILVGPKNHWDIAGGAALVLAAGGRVSDPWGNAIPYNTPEARAPGMVASGAALHPLLIERTCILPEPVPPAGAVPAEANPAAGNPAAGNKDTPS